MRSARRQPCNIRPNRRNKCSAKRDSATLEYLGHGGIYKSNPREQFIEHCWVAPFVEESVEELARHLPVERILFGSDFPHGEGYAAPTDFFQNVASFSLEDQRKIMYDNAHQLTFG